MTMVSELSEMLDDAKAQIRELRADKKQLQGFHEDADQKLNNNFHHIEDLKIANRVLRNRVGELEQIRSNNIVMLEKKRARIWELEAKGLWCRIHSAAAGESCSPSEEACEERRRK